MRLGKVSDVAAMLKVHPATVWRAVNNGSIPQPIKISAKCVRWDLDQIEQSLKQRRVATEKEAAQ